MTRVLGEFQRPQDAAPALIETICRALGWACGAWWASQDEEGTIACVGAWSASPEVDRFLDRDRTKQARGGGLRGRAWTTGEPVWVEDLLADPTFRRRDAAAATGLRSAFAFPVTADDRVIGVIEFFSQSIHQPDTGFLDCTRYIGSQIGQFCRRVEAQARLKESEERFQSTIELAAVGIAHVGLDGRFLHVNQWLCDLLGYTRDELLALSVKDISHPEDRDVSDRQRQQLSMGELESFRLEKRYLRKDGSVAWVSLAIAMRRGSGGEPLHHISVVEDISARKHEERLLRLEHAVTRCLAEADSAAVALPALMRQICESEGWACGEYWGRDEKEEVLRFGGFWNAYGPSIQHHFESAHAAVFPPGVGLAGRVWQSGEPLWIADVSADARLLRRALARDAGLRGAFLFPVGAADALLGVFAFWSREIREPDPRTLEAIRVIGSQVGQFLRRKQADERIRHLASHDALTGLPNRAMFSQLLNLAIATSQRYKRKFSVLFLDLDRFKLINDTLGHDAGDQLLLEVSARLKHSVRASDVVARLSGDEFVMLVQEIAGARQARIVAGKVLSALLRPVLLRGQECRVTASIGIALYPQHALDEAALMNSADLAMYAAKEEGKNCFQVYSKGLKSKSLEKPVPAAKRSPARRAAPKKRVIPLPR